ncbi:MAG: hypothetical protein V4604_14185 [Bacteroidota bacterium]
MNTRKIQIAALFTLPFLVSGCFTSSFLQTAKPLDKGNAEVSVGATGYLINDDPLPGVNAMVRVGVGARSEVGLGYATGIFGHTRLDYKYNFYRSANEKRFLSSGLGLDYFFNDDDGNGIPGVNVPLYFSINHGGSVVPYFGQRFTLGLNDLDVLSGKGRGSHVMYYSGAAGIRFGKRHLKGFLELGYSVSRERSLYSFIDYDTGLEHKYDNHYESLSMELNVGLTIPFGGGREE